MRDYPQMITPVGHIEPVPRRIRAVVQEQTVVDTTRALYVWEAPYYPQFYIPRADVAKDVLVDEDHEQKLTRGIARRQTLKAGDTVRPAAARLYGPETANGLADTVRFEWDAADAWYEEDEQVFVHPRNPYVRVDALRSTRRVRIEIDGVELASTSSPVMVFETGLPTRYYLNRTDVNLAVLEAGDTQTACPYKGVTSGYWSARIGGTEHRDIAWAYDFPTRQLLPIAGLIAFYNEKVDTYLDDVLLERPETRF